VTRLSDSTNTTTFTLVLNGQDVLARYQPDWLCLPGLGVRHGHTSSS
jgi:hypothetical protein